jgi:hypothetical protein
VCLQTQMQPSDLLVLQLGLHLVEAVCLLRLIAGGVGQELEHMVVAMAVLIVGSPGTLQALAPVRTKQVRPPPIEASLTPHV